MCRLIKRRDLKMYLKLHVHSCLVFGVLSALILNTTQLDIIGNVSVEGNYYIRLEYGGRSWSDAQQRCNQYNATLPIAVNPEHKRSVEAAVYYFHMNETDLWLGANASDYGSLGWRWLDGIQYSRTEVRNAGTYNRSYAFLSNRSSDILAYAAAPYEKYSYICEYNTITADNCTNGTGRLAFVNESRCFVKYVETLSWFNARNNCLGNKGDLASFGNPSLLYGIVDSFGSWVGLRHSQWNWQNAVTGLSSEVTFTSWSIKPDGQPNDPTPTCLSMNYGDFPNWKDWNCSHLTQYICQVVNTTSPISTESPSTSRPTHSTVTSLRIQTYESPGNGSINGESNVGLAIRLGVGLGCALIIAIVVVIIVIFVRRKHRNSDSSGKSKSTEPVATEHCQMNPDEEARNYNQSKSEDASALYGQVQKDRGHDLDSKNMASSNHSRSDDSSTHYASVKEVKGLDSDSQVTYPVNQGPVYADLGFEQSRM